MGTSVLRTQWNLSIVDTLGPQEMPLILLYRLNSTVEAVLGSKNGVLFRTMEVLIKEVPLQCCRLETLATSDKGFSEVRGYTPAIPSTPPVN